MLAAKLLSPDEYEAWLLVDNQGYSSQEAALALGEDPEKLGRTDAAVRGLLFRARAKLIPLVQSAR
jgi:DNA-directed RNA polymerase specialized sigma24 family protein